MSAIAATLISILQAFVFCCIGPTVLLFGPAVAKSVTVVQACLASGYLSLMNSIIAIQPDSVMVVFEGGFYMLTGALALAFAALKSETGSQMMKGMATGYLVAEPMLLLGSKALYSGVAGCTRLGNPTIEFPQGQPLGPEGDEGVCTPESKKFLMCFYIMKALLWIATIGSGQLGIIFNEFFLVFSSAMTGASMTVMAFKDLILSIATEAGGKELAEKIAIPLAGVTMILTYSLAGVGFLVMRGMAKRFREQKARKNRKKEKAKQEAAKAAAGGGTDGGAEEAASVDAPEPEKEEAEDDSANKGGKKVVPVDKGKKKIDDDDGPLPEPEGAARFVMKYCGCFLFLLKMMEKLETWIEGKLEEKPKEDKAMKKKMQKPKLKKGKGNVVPENLEMAQNLKATAKAKAEEAKAETKKKAEEVKAEKKELKKLMQEKKKDDANKKKEAKKAPPEGKLPPL